MGPCAISETRPGVCGATADTVAARNLLREVAAGTAAHSGHGRNLALLLKAVGEGRGGNYQIRDEGRLRATARTWGVEETGRDVHEVAREVADLFLREFTLHEGKLKSLALAPEPRQGVWDRLGIAPAGIDSTVVEALHRTHMGTDHDYKNLVKGALKTAIADGWAGSMIATTVSDILFGTPKPIRARANLGVLEEKQVNVLVHGHEPALTEILVTASRDPEIVAAAREVGAEGVNLAGICCTANEVLMRHGVPVAGNFLQQELAIITGAVDCYHTRILTSNPIAKNMNAEAIDFDPANAMDSAKEILHKAIENFPNRDPGKVAIPDAQSTLVAGFSNETIFEILGGTYRRSFRPLNEAIISGRIRGICGIVGCTNARGSKMDDYILTLSRELIGRDVIVLQTGCGCTRAGGPGAAGGL